MLESNSVAVAITREVNQHLVSTLVIGISSHVGLFRYGLKSYVLGLIYICVSQMSLCVETNTFTGIVMLPRKYQPMCQTFVQFMLSQKESSFFQKINHRQMGGSMELL